MDSDDNRDMLDRVLGFGAGFDFFTPLRSLIQTHFGKLEGHKVNADYMPYIDLVAGELGIKLRNRSIHGDLYLFDCRPNEWRRIEYRMRSLW